MGSTAQDLTQGRKRHGRVGGSRSSGRAERVKWSDADAKLVVQAIEAACSTGGCLRFGTTRDGGAYAVGVYDGDEVFTDYTRPEEDIDGYLMDLASYFSDPERKPASTPEGHQTTKKPPKRRF